MTRSRSTLLLCSLLAAALLAALPATAAAGTVELRGGAKQRLSYRAADGEANRLTIRYRRRAAEYVVADRVGVTPGRGCVLADPADPTRARCAVTARRRTSGVVARLGDRNDRAGVSGAPARLSGGSGGDVLVGGSQRDVLDGGPGSDRLDAGAGADRVRARDGSIDHVSCGSGRDVASLDALDYFADRCERAPRTRRGGGTLLSIRAVDGRLELRIGCPRDSRPACGGRVRVIETETRGARSSAAFRLRAGTSRLFSFRFSRRTAERLRDGGRANVAVIVRSRTGRAWRIVTFTARLGELG